MPLGLEPVPVNVFVFVLVLVFVFVLEPVEPEVLEPERPPVLVDGLEPLPVSVLLLGLEPLPVEVLVLLGLEPVPVEVLVSVDSEEASPDLVLRLGVFSPLLKAASLRCCRACLIESCRAASRSASACFSASAFLACKAL